MYITQFHQPGNEWAVIAVSYTHLAERVRLLTSAIYDILGCSGLIRIAKVREYDYNDALKVANDLEKLSRTVEIPDMVRLMKKTVPEFISKNSQFEVFDKES